MAQQEPITPTTCDHCGKAFNTSAVHPRRYCSIACEEGRGTLAQSHPESPGYHLYLQGNPESLVGKWLVASGLSLVDYSPDWCKGPDDWSHGVVQSHDPESETYIRKDDVVIGRVYGYHDDEYFVNAGKADEEKEERVIDSSIVVEQVNNGCWWVDG